MRAVRPHGGDRRHNDQHRHRCEDDVLDKLPPHPRCGPRAHGVSEEPQRVWKMTTHRRSVPRRVSVAFATSPERSEWALRDDLPEGILEEPVTAFRARCERLPRSPRPPHRPRLASPPAQHPEERLDVLIGPGTAVRGSPAWRHLHQRSVLRIRCRACQGSPLLAEPARTQAICKQPRPPALTAAPRRTLTTTENGPGEPERPGPRASRMRGAEPAADASPRPTITFAKPKVMARYER